MASVMMTTKAARGFSGIQCMDSTCYSSKETQCCLCWSSARSSVMKGSYNTCEMLYLTQMPLKPLAALVVIVMITYLFLATDQSSPTATAVGANTGF